MRLKGKNFEVYFDEKGVQKKIKNSLEKTQFILDNTVVKDTSPFVPFLSGSLDASPITSAQRGKGLIVYNKPYAKRLYYGTGFNFTKSHHPKAGAYWFERAKKIHLKKWLEIAKGGFKKWWKN